MKSYANQILEKLKSVKLDKNLLIFLNFLLVSSFFWFLNAITNEYDADISIPVKYINLPDNKLVIGNLADELKVKVNALGHEIMTYKTSKLNPVVINLKKHPVHIVDKNNEQRYYVLTSTLNKEVAAALSSNMEIKKIEPDSLIFKLEEVISKKLPVISNLQLNFKPQYKLKNGIILIPDSVVVKAEKSMLDTISCVYTDSVEVKNISDSTFLNLNINEVPGALVSPNKVACILEVEKFTEMSYQLPIKVINAPKDYKIKLFPASVKLTFNVGFSKYKTVYKEQFSVVANYEKIKNGKKRISLKLMSKPHYVSDVRIVPKVVDYIIEKND